MSALAQKLRKAREVEVKAAGFTFIARRPTDLEMIELGYAKAGRAILPFVIGWEGVSELSILGTGSPHPVEFDPELCAEWLEDRLDILKELIEAIHGAYSAHVAMLGSAVKN